MEIKHQNDIEDLQERTTGLNIESIRDFLCEGKNSSYIGLKGLDIGIQGDGPWNVREFQDFLLSKDFNVANITESGVRYIVLGSRNIDEDELQEQITKSIEEKFDLYIFTQELFLAWLITGDNPLNKWSDEDLLDSVINHESLQYLIDSTEFPWPQLVDHEFIKNHLKSRHLNGMAHLAKSLLCEN